MFAAAPSHALGAEEMDVARRAADEEDAAPRGDAAVDLRRQDVADELVAQGDEVRVRRHQQARELGERHRPRAVHRQAALDERRLHPVGLRAGGVQPEDDPRRCRLR